jgi:acetyl/propionyl-CoA carboxylase alpha subunit
LNTNISFIKTVAEHPEFIKGEVETGFIQQYEKDLLHLAPQVDPNTLALAAHAIAVKEKTDQKVNPNGECANHEEVASNFNSANTDVCHLVQILLPLGPLFHSPSVSTEALPEP